MTFWIPFSAARFQKARHMTRGVEEKKEGERHVSMILDVWINTKKGERETDESL